MLYIMEITMEIANTSNNPDIQQGRSEVSEATS